MAKLNIITIPNPILNCICAEVPSLDLGKELGQSMLDLMQKTDGVGLAAPQVGLRYKMFVASENGKSASGEVFISPKIISLGGPLQTREEGCLSIPHILLPIARRQEVVISYRDRHGAEKEMKYIGLMARIIQHEYDHLSGMLITDRYREQNDWWSSGPTWEHLR